ncbi:hypothetical protein [Bacillus mycoides]|uniref:hypothetical protein n=1 Tax=Bacillus mycoides TaxID=1405 RepID=UPI00027C1961|nr:hypothetical protein [Bacillus mycoides]EJV59349.1 hypothetical protein IEU_05614 [Bacillus mycoides]
MKNRAVSILSVALMIVSIMLVIVSFNKAMEKAKEPTLRDVLSKPTPMVASFEVTNKHHGVYQLTNVNGDKEDIGDYALEGDYEIGQVVTVLFATEDSTEIAGDVLVGKASELDKQHCKAGCK